MVSIIIPAFNSAATIVEALESVLAQSLWDMGRETLDVKRETGRQGSETSDVRRKTCGAVQSEVIVVDDCSTDDTAQVVREWISRHSVSDTSHVSRFTCHALPVNGGPARARNKGMAEAHGEWIAFLDADDLWLPNHVEDLLAAAQETGAVMVCGESVRFADSGSKMQDAGCRMGDSASGSPYPASSIQHPASRIQPPASSIQPPASSNQHPASSIQHPASSNQHPVSSISLPELARHNPIATSTVMVKRAAVLAAGGFDEQFRGPEDYDLWIRVAALPRDERMQDTRCRMQDGAKALPPLHPDSSIQHPVSNIQCLHKPVSLYRQATGSLSMDERKFLPQVLRVIEKAYEKGGALEGLPQWRNAALATQYQQASWMAFCRGARGTALRHLAKALIYNLKGPERIQKPWVKLAYRYVVGRIPGDGSAKLL